MNGHNNTRLLRSRQPTLRTRRRGTVLLTVTVVVMLISLAAFGFATRMQTEHKAALATADQLQARAAARSGVALVGAVLEQPRQFRDTFGGLLDNPARFRGQLIEGTDFADRPNRFSIVARPLTDVATRSLAAESALRFGIDDEATRIHLPTLLKWDREHPGAGRYALMHLPGMSEIQADHLLDWLDADSQPRQFGAESYADKDGAPGETFLAKLKRPGNRIPVCLEELLEIPGFTHAHLFGNDSKRTYHYPPAHAADPVARGSFRDIHPEMTAAWDDYLTLYSGERNEAADGRPRISVNQPELGILHQVLANELNLELANFTIALRQFGPTSPGTDATRSQNIAVDLTVPATYRIESLLDLVDTSVAIPTGENKPPRTLASPFRRGTADLYTRLAAFLDRCTTTAEPILTGRISLTTAPREVLLGIPDLDAGVVERILTTRQARPDPNVTRNSAIWLWTDGLVDLERMKRLLPRLTTRSDVVRFQTIGFCDTDSPTYRLEVILDASQKPPQIVRLVDLQRLGRGFDLRTLGWQSPVEDQTLEPGATFRRSSQRKDSLF
ncbi:MAG: hypothetical protein CMJ75_16940 [Planctomycetaceae bacterium]|nr:hypothetical protein [Planctomycetaceae bacterium]